MIKTYCDYNFDIKISHERCKKLGINQYRIYSKKIISGTEFQKEVSSNRDLIVHATPYMEKLMKFVKELNFFILLTDRKGCILNAIGDEKILSEAFSMKMVPGAFMNEENIGTNAISIVINTNEPSLVYGNQHFINMYYKWACYAAPIKDDQGRLVGVLNFTGYSKNVHPHTLGMVIAASDAISERLSRKSYMSYDTGNKYKKMILDSIPIAIITSNVAGKIETLNKKAMEVINNGNSDLNIKNMRDIIEDWNKIKRNICLVKNFSGRINIVTQRNRLKCRLTANTVYDSKKNAIEIVYVLHEVEKVKRNKTGQAYYTFDKIIGQDENFIKVVEYAKKIADSKSTILIMGESGTGKELFAQSIHNYSSRVDGPFIALNCGAIPKQLIESELFGYEEGSFTGAKKGGNPGKFEIGNGGTIMLDEIGEMPMDMQTRLLRVLQEGIITRIGGTKYIHVDVRVIAVTNRDLKKEVERGRFRKDLYYRLNVLPIYLPPLRDRKSDILPLIRHFIKAISKRLNKKDVIIPDKYLKEMINYDWPGNIRELENLIELLINTQSIPSGYFGKEYIYGDKIVTNEYKECMTLEQIEKEHIIKTLKIMNSNITHSARALGIRRNTLYSKIKKYNIKI